MEISCTKHANARRRSTVLRLPVQLVFPGFKSSHNWHREKTSGSCLMFVISVKRLRNNQTLCQAPASLTNTDYAEKI